MLLAMSGSEENPFLRALKRLKESFIATSQEADQLVREAESVCSPSCYDQKLEKKLNLYERDEETNLNLKQAKEDIENFSLTLHKVVYSEYLEEDTSGVEQAPCTNDSLHTTHEYTVIPESVVESAQSRNESIDKTNSPDISSPLHQAGEEPIYIYSDLTETYQSNVTDTSTSNKEDTHATDLADELEKLREQFAEERESFTNARLAFLHNIRSVAAVTIQTYWRGYHMHKLYYPQVKRLLEMKIQSVVRLQSFCRRHIAMQYYKCLKTERKKKAIILIQNWWRVCLAKRLYRELILASESERRRSAVLIQAVWREYRRRLAYLKILSGRHIEAAVCIQSLWRGYVDRKIYTLLLLAARKQEDERIALVNSTRVLSQRITEVTNSADMNSQPTRDIDNIVLLPNPIENNFSEIVPSSDEIAENSNSLTCTSGDNEARESWVHDSSVEAISMQANKSNSLLQQPADTDHSKRRMILKKQNLMLNVYQKNLYQ